MHLSSLFFFFFFLIKEFPRFGMEMEEGKRQIFPKSVHSNFFHMTQKEQYGNSNLLPVKLLNEKFFNEARICSCMSESFLSTFNVNRI